MISPTDITCPTCRKTLHHDKRYCPLFPEVQPPPELSFDDKRMTRVPGKKWDRCVCLVHTCSVRRTPFT